MPPFTTSSRLNTYLMETSGPCWRLCECSISTAIVSVAGRVCSSSATVPVSMCSLSTPHHCHSSRTIGIMSSMGKFRFHFNIQYYTCMDCARICNVNFCPFSLLSCSRIMSLQALDEYVVSDEEIIENLRLHGSFRTFSPQLKLHLYTFHCKVRL